MKKPLLHLYPQTEKVLSIVTTDRMKELYQKLPVNIINNKDFQAFKLCMVHALDSTCLYIEGQRKK